MTTPPSPHLVGQELLFRAVLLGIPGCLGLGEVSKLLETDLHPAFEPQQLGCPEHGATRSAKMAGRRCCGGVLDRCEVRLGVTRPSVVRSFTCSRYAITSPALHPATQMPLHPLTSSNPIQHIHTPSMSLNTSAKLLKAYAFCRHCRPNLWDGRG